MNQYIEKYGDNAIQAYKKSLRISQSLQKSKDNPSPIKQQSHLLPKKSTSKRSIKSTLNKRTQSQSKLTHSKSIKNNSKIQDQQRKKGSSFIDGSKKLINTTTQNGFSHTFSKLNPNVGKKKLIITQSNTPKCSTPKLHINLNLHKHIESQKQSAVFMQQQKDKLTQRIQRSSGKKNIDKCSTSQSKPQSKRSFLTTIQNRLEDALTNCKRTLKSLSISLRDSFEIILMNEQDLKLRKIFLLFKQVTQRICNIGQKYKTKYAKANQKIHSLQMIHHAYLSNQVYHTRSKSKLQSQLQKSNRKQCSIETIILNQNYDLRKKIHKLQKQLQYYTSQSASLMNVFGKYKNSQSQLRIGKQTQQARGHSSIQKRDDVFSNNKLQKRRSSQNLLYNQLNENPFSYGVQKRLSFDPAVLQSASDAKRKLGTNLYGSMSSSAYSQAVYHQNDQYDPKKGHRNQKVEQLSQEQDSQNES